MRNRQRGITFLGLLVLIVVAGTWVYAGIRLTPVYLEYMRIASTLEKVRDEYNSSPGTTDFMIRKSIERQFDINYVERLTPQDISIKRKSNVFEVTAAYEATTPFIYNVSFLAEFEKTVEIAIN